MLLFILDYLQKAFSLKIPAVFAYSSTRMILSAITTVVFTIFLGPRFIKKLYELKIGQPVRTMEECPLLAQLHGKKQDTPTMGGILILSSMLLSLFLWMDLSNVFTLILFLTTVVLGFLGGMDDYLKLRKKNTKGLRPKKKMAVQFLFSSLIAIYLLCPAVTHFIHRAKFFRPPVAKEQVVMQKSEGKKTVYALQTLSTREYMERLYVPFVKDPVFLFQGFLTIGAFLLMVIVITGCSNAVNLTDGLDGLAAGCLVMVSAVLALIAFLSNHIDMARYLNILYIEGSGEIAIYLFALAGASIGFLWYNGYPAQVFMGDTGSLALGGIIGVSAVLLRREVLLAIVGGIFVAEAVSVILQVLSYRYRNKKR